MVFIRTQPHSIFVSSFVRKMFLIFLVGAVLYSIFGFLIVSRIAKQQAQKIIESKFDTKIKIHSFSFNPFTFEMSAVDFDFPSSGGKVGPKSKLRFDKFSAKLAIFPLLKREIRLQSVILESAHGQLIVFKDGTTNWAMRKDNRQSESNLLTNWVSNIEQIQINNSTLDILDKTHVSPLELSLGPFSLTASNIKTSLGSKASIRSLDISVGHMGHLRVFGDLSFKPFSADVSLDAVEFPLDFLTAFLSDKTAVRVKKGHADLLGNLKYVQGNTVFNGTAEIYDFGLGPEGDGDPVLVWKKMEMKGVKINTKPLSVQIDTVNLEQPRIGLPLSADRSLNYMDFLRNVHKAPFDFLVSKLVISNGTIHYVKQQMRPQFSVRIHNLEGAIDSISSSLSRSVNAVFSGRIESHGRFEVHGHLTTGVKRPRFDLEMNFRNIDMTIFTPFSDRFVGYEIKKGKLFLDGNYTLLNNKFKGNSQVLLDQFTLGKKVRNEISTKWSPKFVLAIMKDRNGQIKFQLPMEGDVSSPSFSMKKIFASSFKNLTFNTAESPFDSLSQLLGDKDNFQIVFFEPGTSVLQKNELAKLEKLSKALEMRPHITLEIRGEYQDDDVQVLKQKNIQKRLEPLLKSYQGDRAAAVRTLAQSILKREDLSDFISNYEVLHGKNVIGLVDEMEKKLISTVVISENELSSLSLARGNVIMSILAANKIGEDRLSLVVSTKGEGENNKASHATLLIKEKEAQNGAR